MSYLKITAGKNAVGATQVQEPARAERRRKPRGQETLAGVRPPEEEEGGGRWVDEQPQDGHDDPNGPEHSPARAAPEDGLRVEPAEDEAGQEELAGCWDSVPGTG